MFKEPPRLSQTIYNWRQFYVECCSAMLILLFVYTSVTKLQDRERFERVLTASPMIGERADWVSWGIPAVELLITLMIFIHRIRLWGFFMAFLLMAGFTAYIGYMLLYAVNLPCSCGGVLEQLSWRQHLVFNFIVMVLAFLGWYWLRQNQRFIAINRRS